MRISRERLGDLGYGPDDDLSRLHYSSSPRCRRSTRPKAATSSWRSSTVTHRARHHRHDGPRSSGRRKLGGHYRAFYRCTGCRLKAQGIAVLRLDHAGKDLFAVSGAARRRLTISTSCGACRSSRTTSCSRARS